MLRTVFGTLLAVFATACAEQASTSDGLEDPCPPGSCKPVLGNPVWTCPDGSAGGSTGRCQLQPEGGCGPEVIWCDGTACAGTTGLTCPTGQVCVADPHGACDPAVSPDCSGVCVNHVFCGGIAGILCPSGRICVDDPQDGCLLQDGSDCSGLCAPAQ